MYVHSYTHGAYEEAPADTRDKRTFDLGIQRSSNALSDDRAGFYHKTWDGWVFGTALFRGG